MQLELVTWKVFSIKPLIQSNPHMMWESAQLAAEAKAEAAEKGEKVKPTSQKKGLVGTHSENFKLAASQLYVNEEGQHYHPAEGFWNGLLMACDGREMDKVKDALTGRKVGETKNALVYVARGVTLMDEEFLLCDPATLDEKQPRHLQGDEWQIDYRRAVNHNMGKAEGGVGIVAVRPKWKVWGGLVTFEVDREIFSAIEPITSLLNIAGHYIGLGVGRRRVKAMVRQKPVWSGFGSGKYRVEMK